MNAERLTWERANVDFIRSAGGRFDLMFSHVEQTAVPDAGRGSVVVSAASVSDLVPWVWCACHARCGGIGVPGFVVRGTLELCVACAAADRTEKVMT